MLLVARVGEEKGGYAITLLDSSRASGAETIATSYASQEIARAAADAIVRTRYGHTCVPSCSGWTEDAETR
jgi:hypothetical protein